MNVFKQEWKNILSSRVMLGTLIVLLLVPIMYSGIFLSSAWDPYGRTGNLPVAVVNSDEPAKYGNQTLNLGKELVEQLRDNDALEWHFADSAEAEQGLKSGDYYMIITIPPDFSANASTVLDAHPKPLNLTYKTNPGRNYFASVVSSQAAATVKESVARNITETYAKALLEQLGTIAQGFGSAADGSKQIAEGLTSAMEGNQQLKDGLQKLADSTLTFSDGADQMVTAVNSVQDGAARLSEGANQLSEGVASYTAGVSTLQAGSGKFTQGADQLLASTPALLSGAEQLADGAEQIAPGLRSLAGGAESARTGSSALTKGLQDLNTAAAKLADTNAGVPSLASSQEQLHSAISQLQTGAAALQAGLDQLSSSLPAEEQTKQLTLGLAGIQQGIGQLSQSVSSATDLSAAASSIVKNLDSMQKALLGLSNQTQASGQELISTVESTAAYKSLNLSQQQEMLQSLTGQLARQGEQHQSQLQILSASLTELSGTLNHTVIPAVQGLDSLPANLQKLNETVQLINPKASTVISAYPKLASVINDQLLPGSSILNQGLTQALTGSSQLVGGIQNVTIQMPILAESTNKLLQGSQSLNQGLVTLSDGSKQLADAADQFDHGSSSFSAGVTKYSQGALQLNNGAQQISGGLAQLAAKSGDLTQGSDSLRQGLASLSSNLPALANGAAGLLDGADQLHSGSAGLLEGSRSLYNGLDKLNSGSADLSAELGSGAVQINKVNTNDANAEMIANPVSFEKQEYSKVPNYGHALAPYVLILGLFVGAIAFNLVFPLARPAGIRASGFSWWFSKFTVGALQASLAALVMIAIMKYGMDLQVDHMAEFVLLAVLVSITFMFLVMFLGIAFGNAGRLLSMLLLVVQLGASGGMFPMELSNPFFRALHPWLPMSYAVEGAREALSSSMAGGQYSLSIAVLTGFIILFNLLLLGVMTLKSRRAPATADATDSYTTAM